MRKTSLSSSMRLWRLSVVAATALSAVPAAAMPGGGKVTGGNVTITHPSPDRLVIDQRTQRGAIDWNSFSIGKGESVRFNQPDASSITFNRVTGPDPSHILGNMSATGQVWLVNPNGVLFGTSARVDTAGLVTSTAGMAPKEFMAGSTQFSVKGRPDATIVNQGDIRVRDGGMAAFVAPGVRNSGLIEAQVGKVALASGDRYTLDLYGDGLVKLAVDDKVADKLVGTDGKPMTARVENSGTIRADGGSVVLTTGAASQVVDNVINVSGTVQARAATVEGGRIVLQGSGGSVTVSGKLDASGTGEGQRGGMVAVTGGRVALDKAAVVDASGSAGGGTALIGGNERGKGPLPNATRTTVATGATIKADATRKGKGGKVVVWSDGDTRFGGNVSAKGGRAGGDGGFVEVSGKKLQYAGKVDLAAPAGNAGTLLLDPTDIRIVAGPANPGGPDGGTAINIDAGVPDRDDLNDVTVISNGDLAGKTVWLDATRDVIIDAPVNTVRLDIDAGRNIEINASVTTGALSLTAGGGYLNGDPDTTGGIIINSRVIATGFSFISAKDNLDVNSPLFTGRFARIAAGSINIDNVIETSGPLALIATSDINVNARINAAGAPPVQGLGFWLDMSAGGTIGGSGTIISDGATRMDAATLTLPGGDETALGNEISGPLRLAVRGDAVFRNRVTSTFNRAQVDGAFTLLQTGGGVQQTGAVIVGGSTTIDVRAANQSVNLGNVGNQLAGAITVANGRGDVLIENSRDTLLGAVDVGGALTLQSLGRITQEQDAAISVGGLTTLGPRGAGARLSNGANIFGGGIRLANGGLVNLVTAGDLTIDGRAGSLTLQADRVTFGTSGQAMRVDGDMTVAAARSIGQGNVLSVGGISVLGSAGSQPVRVALGDPANRFGGSVVLQETGATVLSGETLLAVEGSARSLRADAGTGVFQVGSVQADGLTVAGNLDVAAGRIEQAGSLLVGGTTHLQASLIELLDGANRFSGGLMVANFTAADIFSDADLVITATGRALAVGSGGTLTLAGLDVDTLAASGGDGIDQTAAIDVARSAAFDSAGTVTLTDEANRLSGEVALTGGGDFEITLSGGFIGGVIDTDQLRLRGGGDGRVVFRDPVLIRGLAEITGFDSITLNGGNIRQAAGDIPAVQNDDNPSGAQLFIGGNRFTGAFNFRTNAPAELQGVTGLLAAFAATDNDDFVRRLGRGEATQTPAEIALESRPEYDGYAINPFAPRYDLLGFDRGDPRAASFARDTPYVLDGFWEGLLR